MNIRHFFKLKKRLHQSPLHKKTITKNSYLEGCVSRTKLGSDTKPEPGSTSLLSQEERNSAGRTSQLLGNKISSLDQDHLVLLLIKFYIKKNLSFCH